MSIASEMLELASQARDLNSMVGTFKLRTEGAASRAHLPDEQPQYVSGANGTGHHLEAF